MRNILVAALFLIGIAASAQTSEPTVKSLDNGLVQVTFYHNNGKVAQQGTVKEGKRHGEWKSYNTEGVKTAQAQYSNDLKIGKWFIWNDSELIEIDYSKNQIASINRWVNKEAIANNRP